MTTPITIEELETRHSELGALIEKFKQQAADVVFLRIPEVAIEMKVGEIYAGLVIGDTEGETYHLMLLPGRTAKRMAWDEARVWAEKEGGALPTRREQSLLFANAKKHFKDTWYWSGETYEDDASCAWGQLFTNGGQSYRPKSYEGLAVAVRRVPL